MNGTATHFIATQSASVTALRTPLLINRSPVKIAWRSGDTLLSYSTSGLAERSFAFGMGLAAHERAAPAANVFSVAYSVALKGRALLQEISFPFSEVSDSGALAGLNINFESWPDERARPQSAVFAFADKIAKSHLARAISWNAENDSVHVWTFIDSRDKKIRRQIYSKEFELMQEYPTLNFDFNVVSLDTIGVGSFGISDSRGQLIYYQS